MRRRSLKRPEGAWRSRAAKLRVAHVIVAAIAAARHELVLGFASTPVERIRAGVSKLKDAFREVEAAPGARFQFERLGYFCADAVESKPGAPVWNRTVQLKDGWSKIAKTR